MIDLRPIIDRINALLDEDTEASVTYAALEARLGLEKVCYDRLRQRHGYISHAHLSKWQPSGVVNILMEDVDQHITQTRVLSMGKNEAQEGVIPDDDDYVEIGTEIGVGPKRISRLWNALSKLALHVNLPTNSQDRINQYGNKAKIRAKIEEAVEELECFARGTLMISGIGPEVSFVCSCGGKNKRRAELLREGQHIHCINPDCKVTWKVVKEGDGLRFESVTVPVNCEQCKAANHMPWRLFLDMKHDEVGSFTCHTCEHKNYVQWRLMQVRPESSDTQPSV